VIYLVSLVLWVLHEVRIPNEFFNRLFHLCPVKSVYRTCTGQKNGRGKNPAFFRHSYTKIQVETFQPYHSAKPDLHPCQI